MTNEEKNKVYDLRDLGYRYKKISTELGISEGTIKSFLTRHPSRCIDVFCVNCGLKLVKTPKKKEKKYCSDRCKKEWMKKHPILSNKGKVEECTCSCCGAVFYSYKTSSRRFCSQECYRKNRYSKDGGNND